MDEYVCNRTKHNMGKAIRLLEFLKELASIRAKKVRNINSYEKVLWLKDIPHEDECFTQTWGENVRDDLDVWVEVKRRNEPELPRIPEPCEDWVNESDLKNKSDIPKLNSEIATQLINPDWQEDSDQSRYIDKILKLEDSPEIQQAWDNYIGNHWNRWVEEHNKWENIHKVYTDLFEIHQIQLKRGEEYELVLGLGLLTWQPPNGERVRRHVLTANAILEFEARSGKFIVRSNPDGANVRPELDMLEIEDQPAQAENQAKETLKEAEDNPWDMQSIENALKEITHFLRGNYREGLEETARINDVVEPLISYAPAIILRERSSKGIIDIIKEIKLQVENEESLPPGFADLAEINHVGGTVDRENINNSSSDFTGEIYFPKFSNAEQRKIIDKLQYSYGVLVQGPPGTGKSHTIANLICHLLAKGNRILVTAKTPRALQVLMGDVSNENTPDESHNGLIPKKMRPLCISLLGKGAEEKRSLESSVSGILKKEDEWNPSQVNSQIKELEQKLQKRREEKSIIDKRLIAVRESEIHPQTVADGRYHGTASQIAMQVNRDDEKLSWFKDAVPIEGSCPVSQDMLRNTVKFLKWITEEKRQELSQIWIEPDKLLTPEQFSDLIRREKHAQENFDRITNSLFFIRWFSLKRVQQNKSQIEKEIQKIKTNIIITKNQENAHSVIEELLQSFKNRSLDEYSCVYTKFQRLQKDKETLQEGSNNKDILHQHLLMLACELEQHFTELYWEQRIQQFQDAWYWKQAKTYIDEYIKREDAESLQIRSAQIVEDIQDSITEIASLKAWSVCMSRLQKNDGYRKHMTAWQQAINQLGQGTGRHAFRHRRDAQNHLNQCREAVPAWVMPLHRVWDTVKPEPSMFDVIIIDEASQCGFEALPLFYLGKKIIIVGDDKQISPDAVGIDQGNVYQLMKQKLFDFQFQSSFDILSSLFDQGKLRFGTGRITLREHFRCMPEIIRFSNDLCYADTPLIPLRQYGPDRLEPLQHVYVEKGYREGSNNNVINRPEAESLVEKIKELCEDERYSEKSMGVVVLQGEKQAKLIEIMLLEELGAEMMETRRLICGNPYHFQGDERDIIFLSMVAAPNANIGTLTTSNFERRFNVAASRAKDQLWLFHSVTCNDLSPLCLRRRLLVHFQNPVVQNITGLDKDELERRAFQDNRQIVKPPPPFDSWFEVDVALEIARKGFHVIPQFEVANKRIDLVVEGGLARLAVECDGDEWHGVDQYDLDMQRQRMLERCGWQFFRVRASAFYANKETALLKLWNMLEERGIYPHNVENDNSKASLGESDFLTSLEIEIQDALGTLTEREESVLRMRYGLDDGEPRNVEDVGDRFGITPKKVRQIEQLAIRKLRHPLRAQRLKPFLDILEKKSLE